MTPPGAVWEHKLLWLVHVVGNAAAALAVWWWLGLPEATVWQVALSAAAAVVILFAALWMHSAALLAYREPHGVPWMRALRRVPLVLPWFAAIAAAAFYLPFVGLAVVLLLIMPLGAGAWRAYRDWRYYAWAIPLLAVGYVPELLLRWVPSVEGLNSELASLGLRAGAAYLIAVTVWLSLAAAAQVVHRAR